MARRTISEQFQSWCIAKYHRRALTPGSLLRYTFRESGLVAILLLISMTCLQVAGQRKDGHGQRSSSPHSMLTGKAGASRA